MKKSFLLVASVTAMLLASPVMTAVYVGPGKTTITCIDWDGDGYGTGPNCLGRDADDNDAEVNTVESWKAKHSTIDALLTARGYAGILRYWFIDYTNGNDAICVSGTSDVAEASPCKGWDKIRGLLKPGDVVVFRNGRTPPGNRFPMDKSGTAINPILLLGYPGEDFTLDRSSKPDGTAVGDGIAGSSLHDITIDGLNIYSEQPLGNGVNFALAVKNMIVRNVKITGGYTSLRMFEGLENVVIEKNFFTESNATESVYLGARGNPGKDVFYRNNINANVSGLNGGYPAVQYNGRVENYVVEGNVVYGFEQCFSWLMGVSKSTFRRNICFGGNKGMLTIYNYPANQAPDGTCAANAICPYDQTDNLIEYNTLVRSRYNRAGGPGAGVAAIIVNNTSIGRKGDLGRQTVRNNIVWGYGNLPLVWYYNDAEVAGRYLATSKFQNNVWYKFNTVGPDKIFHVGTTDLIPEQFAPLTAEYTGNVVADPKFVHYDVAEWANPELADFHLQEGSPANHAGVYAGEVAPPPPLPEKPTVTFDVQPKSIIEGGSVTATWTSQNADRCDAFGNWSEQLSMNGERSLSPVATAQYWITCTGTGGTIEAPPITVEVVQPPLPPTNDVKAFSHLKSVKPNPVMSAPNLPCTVPTGTLGILKAEQQDRDGRHWWNVDWANGCPGWVNNLPPVRPIQ